MDLKARVAALRNLDPDALSEAELRLTVPLLLSLAEDLLARQAALETEIRALKEEVVRLKGGQGRPKLPGGGAGRSSRGGGIIHPISEPTDHSSETERRERETRKPWQKSAKLEALAVDREEYRPCEGPLPTDAQYKGTVPVVVQDLVLRTETTRFLRAKYYSPSTGKTYLGALPPGYEGQFGPGVRTLALALTYGCHLSQPLVHGFFTDAGLRISRGQVSACVTRGLERFHGEQAAVLAAGLRSSPWQHLDVTPTRVNGVSHACHVLGNPLFASYYTTLHQDRDAALDALRGGAVRQYRLDATAFACLAEYGLSQTLRRALALFPQEHTWSAADFSRLLDRRLPCLGPEQRKQIADAAQIAAYWADPLWPVVQCLVVDDAAPFPTLTPELALCWVHDGRHYAKLNPQFDCHRRELCLFRKRYWDYYRDLLAYREAPSSAAVVRLEAAFDQLFGGTAGWTELETCIRRTQANKTKLLRVLVHPELPLHNNPAELLARRRVRKRGYPRCGWISFGPRSATGMRAWDTFQGLVETTRKLGIRFWNYLRDRVTEAGEVPPLAEVITRQAAQLRLGASWEPRLAPDY